MAPSNIGFALTRHFTEDFFADQLTTENFTKHWLTSGRKLWP
jgi:hypothetical protein